MDAEVTRRVLSGWKNRKSVSGVLCDRMNVNIKGRLQNSGKTNSDVRGRDMGVEDGTGKETRGRRNENATMNVRSYEAGQDQK